MIVQTVLFVSCKKERDSFYPEQIEDGLFEPSDFVKQDGTEISIGKEKIILKGVNLGGWLLTEDWLCPTSLTNDLNEEHGQYELFDLLSQKYGEEEVSSLFEIYRDNWITEKDFKNIKDLGFNCVRLPFGWRDFTDENGIFKQNAFKRIDQTISYCKKYALFVILDLHGAYGSQNGRQHSGDTRKGGALFGNSKNEDLTISLWQTIAERYADEKIIAAYDLLNEPEGVPDGKTDTYTFDFYDRLYDAIRAKDADHIIIFESCWNATDLPNPKKYGWENVAYEYHYYNWENSNSLDSTKSFISSKSAEQFINKMVYKVPVFIGEFTCFDNLDNWRYTLDFFDDAELSWTIWTYKGCVDGNWALYNGYKRDANTCVTGESSLELAKGIFSKLDTDLSFKPNDQLVTFFKDYFNKQ